MTSARELVTRIRGPVPAVHTPLDPAGESLRLEAIPIYVEHLRRQGAPAVYVCGSTGESLALDLDERRRVLDAWIEASGPDLPIIAHVGTNALPDSIELARHAANAGVAAISAMNPTFGRSRGTDELVDFHARIAEAGGDRPYLIYEIAAFGGVSFPASRVAEAASTRIPTFTGMKFTSGDLLELQLLLDLGRRHDLAVFFGCDEHLLAGLTLGCRAAIGSTYGYAPTPAQAVFEAFGRGDLPAARKAQLDIARLVGPLLDHGVLRTGKALLNRVGVPVGAPRRPESSLTVEELAEVLAAIAPLGLPGLGVEAS